jgi:predicted esterase
MIALRIVLFLLLAASIGRAELTRAERRKVREVVTAVLTARKPRERAALVASLADLRAKATLEEIEAAVREGPLLADGPPPARRVAGRKEKITRVGRVFVGYSFEHDGDVYRYTVDVPRKYDPTRAWPVLLDPGHGSWKKLSDREKGEGMEFFRGHADKAGGKDWLVVRSDIVEDIGADARNLPEDFGSKVFQEMFRDLATRYHIDPDRIYVGGLSQTGFWAWFLCRERPDRYAGLAPMAAVTWGVNNYLGNYINLPIYVLHGAEDPKCKVVQPRGTCPALARHGVPIVYREIPGGRHDAGVFSLFGEALAHVGRFTRTRYPARISKSMQTTLDGWCYWVRVDRIASEGQGRANQPPTAGIDGERDGQTIRLYSDGVERVTLALASEMLDLDQPVVVIWNGKQVHAGKVERSLATLLEFVHDKADWRQTFEANLDLTVDTVPENKITDSPNR